MNSGAITPFGLRMPPDVKSWIEQLAQKNMRSQNAEIVLALKEKMARDATAHFGSPS